MIERVMTGVERLLTRAGKKRSAETMKQILILTCMIALGSTLALTGCGKRAEQKAELDSLKTELESLKVSLERAKGERDDIQTKMDSLAQIRDQLQEQADELTGSRNLLQEQLTKLTGSRDQLQVQADELAGSRDQLQEQLTELAGSRDQLQEQIDELTKSRDAAVAEAQKARERSDELLAQLQAARDKLGELQNQLTATGKAEQKSKETQKVEVSKNPTIHSFDTNHPKIRAGQSSTLSWLVSNADTVRIQPGIGSVGTLGSMTVKPSTTTTYTLIATNKAGKSREVCRVEVIKPATDQ